MKMVMKVMAMMMVMMTDDDGEDNNDEDNGEDDDLKHMQKSKVVRVGRQKIMQTK